MMSKGPCSCRLSLYSGTRSTVAASTSSGVSRTKTWRKPSLARPRSDRRSCACCWRTTCGPKSRSSREPIAFVTELLGHVQHDGDRQTVVLPSQFDERLARFRLHVRGVDDRQPAQRQPLGRDEVQHREGVVRDGLVVLFVADHRRGRHPRTESRSGGSACARRCFCRSRWGRSGRRGTVLGWRFSCANSRKPFLLQKMMTEQIVHIVEKLANLR